MVGINVRGVGRSNPVVRLQGAQPNCHGGPYCRYFLNILSRMAGRLGHVKMRGRGCATSTAGGGCP